MVKCSLKRRLVILILLYFNRIRRKASKNVPVLCKIIFLDWQMFEHFPCPVEVSVFVVTKIIIFYEGKLAYHFSK